MEITIGKLLTIKGEKYTVLDVIDYQNNKYAFVNKVDEYEIPTEEFILFKIVGNGVVKVTDIETLNHILVYVSADIQKMIDKAKEGENNEPAID